MKEKTDLSRFPAIVVKVIDLSKVVINRGLDDGVKLHQRFLIYSLSESEIKDPETEISLGHLEIVKGTGEAIHVQPKMSTIKTDMRKPAKRTITRSSKGFSLFSPSGEDYEVIEPSIDYIPFENPKVGDKAKPI